MIEQTAPPLDRWFWLAVLIVALVVIPRSVLITRAHSPCADDQYHLRRGLHYLTDQPPKLTITSVDGPLGDALDAVPMVLAGSTMNEPIHVRNMPDHGANDWIPNHENPVQRLGRIGRRDVLFGHALSPDALLMLIAIWHAVLFIPFAGIAFHWVRWLYGLRSGFLTIALLLIDPSFAAFIPIASIDMFGVEAIVIACFLIWLYVHKPNWRWLIIAGFASAFTLLIKQTAIAIPAAMVGYAILWWIVLPWWRRKSDQPVRLPWRRMFDRLAWLIFLLLLFIWALMKFDFSRPSDYLAPVHNSILQAALQHRWPAGQYIVALINSARTDAAGRWAYLLGHARVGGWWYYYPVLLGMKVPLGFFVIFAMAIWSLRRRKPFFAEWSLVLPFILWGILLLTSRINIGFRHFLPEYALILMLASRCLVTEEQNEPKRSIARSPDRSFGRSSAVSRLRVFVVSAFLAFSAGSALGYHPDYLSYVNYPYVKPWLLMSDSNIDWGQGLKEVRQYLNAHPTHRPVYIRYDWGDSFRTWYLDSRVHPLTQFQRPPRHGLLIICPVWVAGYWDPLDNYGALRSRKPFAMIGHSMLVYDVDQLFKDPHFAWGNR